MLNRKNKVTSLEESFKEIGLDPGKTLDEMNRFANLVEAKTKKPGPPEVQPGQIEGAPAPKKKEEPVEEAFQVKKKKRQTAAQRLKARLGRRRHKAERRKASKMYRKRNKRKIVRRMKAKLRKFGAGRLAKIHAAGRRVVMAHADSELANLREELNSLVEGVNDEPNSFEEAAYNAGVISMYLGEVFEQAGDEQSAETMFTLSDLAADISEELDALSEEEVSEGQQEKLRKILEGVVRALKVYEGIGSPSVYEAMEIEANLAG